MESAEKDLKLLEEALVHIKNLDSDSIVSTILISAEKIFMKINRSFMHSIIIFLSHLMLCT